MTTGGWASLLFLLLVDHRRWAADACPATCRCFRDTVDCSTRDLLDVPPGIPNSTRILNLSGNDIDNIEFARLPYLPSLSTLDLSNNILRNLDSSLFRKFPNLRILHLRRNRLTRLPEGIAQCEHLDKIDLRSNSISKLSSGDFGLLAAVRHVDLSRNLISALPIAKVAKPRIEKLDMASNLLREVPSDAFLSLESLTSLRLSRNKLSLLRRNSFRRLPFLESLDLSRNVLRIVPSLVFNELPSLQNVTFSKNEIHRLEDGIFVACDALSSLNISHNRVPTVSEGWLFGLRNLQTLDISYNHVASFEPNSWSQCRNLRWLSLHGNRLQSLPSSSFRALSRLEELILSGNSIENLHKTAMTGLDNLHRLDLSSNTLAVCVEDGAVLYNTSMPFLRSLRFTNNQLRVIPNRAFERFPALEELDLTDNPIATIHSGAFEPLHLKKLIMNSSALLCDCQIAWFGNWLYESGLENRDAVVAKCGHPPPLQSLDVVAIDVANLTCADDSPRARVIAHPLPVRALVKDSARFACIGYGHALIGIEWRVIEAGKARILVQDATTIINANTTAVINGTMDGRELAASELLLNELALSDRADYQCVVRNRFGADFSTVVSLDVLQPPSFLHEPDDMALLVGHNAKFMCSATGTPQPILKWAYDGGETFPAAEERRLYVIPNDDHLYVMNVTSHDQGVYTCHATNDAGHVQASASLRVFNNKFGTHLASRDVTQGDTVVLECLVDLIPGVQRMVWTKDGSEIKLHHAVRITVTTHGQVLVISMMHVSDAGEYACELWAGGAQLARQSARVGVLTTSSSLLDDDDVDDLQQHSNRAMSVGSHAVMAWQQRGGHIAVGCIVVVVALLVLTALGIGLCCWLRKRRRPLRTFV